MKNFEYLSSNTNKDEAHQFLFERQKKTTRPYRDDQKLAKNH